MSWGYIENLVTRTVKEWIEDDAVTYSSHFDPPPFKNKVIFATTE